MTSSEKENCSICFEDIKENNRAVTNCNHVFHLHCLIKNAKTNTSTGDKCPVCRKNLLFKNDNNESCEDPQTRDIFTDILGMGSNIFNSYINEMTGILPLRQSMASYQNHGSTAQINNVIYSSNTRNSNIIRTTVTRNGITTSSVSHLQYNQPERRENRYRNQTINPQQRSNLTSNGEIYNWIKSLSYSELKNELRRNGLSTRGYIRERLENKLFYKLVGRNYAIN